MEPAVAGPHTQKAPGGGGGHGAGLLVAGGGGGLPSVAPGGEAAEDIGLELQNDARSEHSAAADQRQCGEIPGPHIGDHQEGDEENGRGAEVAHQAQQADTHACQHDEEGQVPLVEQPLQCGGAGEDIADLGDLRRLEGHAADGDPVDGAVFGVADHQGDAQQADGGGRHEPAVLLHPAEVPQEQSQHQKQRQPQQNSQELLEQTALGTGGSDGQ